MTTEPRPLAEGLVRARQALEAATPVPSIDLLDDEDVAAVREIRERGVDELRKLRWHVMCPQRFHRSTLDWTKTQHGDEIVGAILDWQRLFPRPNLILLGPVGTGKTSTAIAACRDDWMNHGIEMVFMPLGRLFDRLRPGGPEGAYEEVVDAGRLVIDDLGQERPSDWTRERLDLVVNDRWLEERPTIVTSNLPPEEFREAVGGRLYSRLTGDGAVVLTLVGDDRRRG